LVAAFAIACAVTAATATAALAIDVKTFAPDVNGNEATFHGEIVANCSPVDGYFVLTDLSTGQSYDSLFSLGFPDQFSSSSEMTYSEGPFGLKSDTDYLVRAHADGGIGCAGGSGNEVYFHIGAGPGNPADVGITQSIGANPKVGQLLTLTIAATNSSDHKATDAFIKDVMPAGFQYVACSLKIDGVAGGFCSWDGDHTVVGDIGDFAAGSTVTLSIGARPTAAGSFVNSVGVGAHEYDPDASNNFADAPITVAGLTALSVETSTKLSTPVSPAIRATSRVARALLRTASTGLRSIIDTCL
jgi:uncharacterized repeat protein (TIGR01451 family)